MKGSNKIVTTIALDPETRDLVENARGKIPISTYINNFLYCNLTNRKAHRESEFKER